MLAGLFLLLFLLLTCGIAMSLKIEERNGSALLSVKVVPNSSREMIAGLLGDMLKVKVAQPPEDGKANHAVELLLARTLGIAPAHVRVIAGHSRPQKTVQIMGVTAEALRKQFNA